MEQYTSVLNHLSGKAVKQAYCKESKCFIKSYVIEFVDDTVIEFIGEPIGFSNPNCYYIEGNRIEDLK